MFRVLVCFLIFAVSTEGTQDRPVCRNEEEWRPAPPVRTTARGRSEGMEFSRTGYTRKYKNVEEVTANNFTDNEREADEQKGAARKFLQEINLWNASMDLKCLGVGAFGAVFRWTTETGDQYAVKYMHWEKDEMSKDEWVKTIEREAGLLKKATQPVPDKIPNLKTWCMAPRNIQPDNRLPSKEQTNSSINNNVTRFIGYFLNDKRDKAMLVTEFACGKDMFSLLVEQLKEKDFSTPGWMHMSKNLMWQLLNGIVNMHRMNMVHSDIKPENVLVDNNFRKVLDIQQGNSDRLFGNKTTNRPALRGAAVNDAVKERMLGGAPQSVPTTTLKLCDFGEVIDSTEGLKKDNSGGTVNYFAPELLLKFWHGHDYSANKMTDVWSMGCLFYTLACGLQGNMWARTWTGSGNIEEQGYEFDGLSNGKKGKKSGNGSTAKDGKHAPNLSKVQTRLRRCLEKALKEGKELITEGEFSFDKTYKACAANKHLPEEFWDLMRQCHNLQKEKRPSAEKLLEHPFFAELRADGHQNFLDMKEKAEGLQSDLVNRHGEQSKEFVPVVVAQGAQSDQVCGANGQRRYAMFGISEQQFKSDFDAKNKEYLAQEQSSRWCCSRAMSSCGSWLDACFLKNCFYPGIKWILRQAGMEEEASQISG